MRAMPPFSLTHLAPLPIPFPSPLSPTPPPTPPTQVAITLMSTRTARDVLHQVGTPLLAASVLMWWVWARGTASVEQPQLCRRSVAVWE